MNDQYTPERWFWIIGGDESQFWSSEVGAYVEELPDGWYSHIRGAVWAGEDETKVKIPTRIETEAALDEVLAAYGLLGPTARRMVRKSVVQARLIEAGKMDAAYAALTQMPAAFARWFAPDRPYVYADDPDALALLAAIGADAETIMAPE